MVEEQGVDTAPGASDPLGAGNLLGAGIVWLASYPKSGNTWMRVLLTNYLGRDWRPADINDLDGGPIASSRSLFDWTVGIKSSHLNDDEADAFRPALYRFVASRAAKPVVMKVHDAWFPAPSGEPLFPAEATRTVIYIVRNPLDVAVSWAHHYDVDLDRAVEALCDPANKIGGSGYRLYPQLRQRLGTWSEHVVSWVDTSALPVHVVRYEDMLADTASAFAAAVEAAGWPVDPDKVQKAVDFSRFERLRAQEEEADFRERRGSSPFFRSGRSGDWRDHLSEAHVARLVACHGEVMRRFGYEVV